MYSKILTSLAGFLLTFIAIGIAYLLVTHGQKNPIRYISLSSIEGSVRAPIDSVELHGEITYDGINNPEVRNNALDDVRSALKHIFKNANINEANIVFIPINTEEDSILYDIDQTEENPEYIRSMYMTQEFVITVPRDRFEGLPDAMIAAHDMDNIDITSMKRRINDIASAKHAARKQAWENAKLQAQELAESMYMRLGSVVGIDGSESYFYESDLNVSWYDMNTPDTIRTMLDGHDVSAQISVTFELY